MFLQPSYKKSKKAHPSHKEKSIPSLVSMQEHLLTRDAAIAYLLDNGGIKNIAGTACENVYATFGRSGYRPDNACPGKLVQKTSVDFSAPDYARYFRWAECKCLDRSKSVKFVPISRDTFFEGSHVPTHVLLLLALLWISGVKHTSIQVFTGLAQATVTLWLKKILVAIQWDVLNHPDGQMIGGDKIHVQVDESKVCYYFLSIQFYHISCCAFMCTRLYI